MGGLKGYDHGEHNDEDAEANENFFEHRIFISATGKMGSTEESAMLPENGFQATHFRLILVSYKSRLLRCLSW